MTFYDTNGKPIAYSKDGKHIYLFTGEPVAYFFRDTVYSFDGRHLGWFENGWIRDLQGRCVFFTEYAKGITIKPIKKFKPSKRIRKLRPLKSPRERKKMKPIKKMSWSNLSGPHFFT